MSVPGILLNVGLGLLGAHQAETRSSVNSVKEGKQDFEQLLESIQKGDLAAAQQALSGLQQAQAAVQGNQPAAATGNASNAAATTASSPLAKDFAALGSALNSGSLSGAQDAFAKLQQDFETLRQKGSPYGSSGHAAEVYSMLQQLEAAGLGGSATETASTRINSFVSTMDKVNGDFGAFKQALQSGNQPLSQDALTRLLQDLRASSLLGRSSATTATTVSATA
jgi:hypothetical protein